MRLALRLCGEIAEGQNCPGPQFRPIGKAQLFPDPLPVGFDSLNTNAQLSRDVAGSHPLAKQPKNLQFSIGKYGFVTACHFDVPSGHFVEKRTLDSRAHPPFSFQCADDGRHQGNHGITPGHVTTDPRFESSLNRMRVSKRRECDEASVRTPLRQVFYKADAVPHRRIKDDYFRLMFDHQITSSAQGFCLGAHHKAHMRIDELNQPKTGHRLSICD